MLVLSLLLTHYLTRKEINMAKFLVVGNKRIYKMETLDMRTAWELAEKEMNNYKLTGNTKIIDIIRKDTK